MSEKYYEVDLKALREAVESELAEAMKDDVEEGAYAEGEEVDEEASLEEMLQELKLVLDLGDDIEEDQIPEELRGMVEEDDEAEGDDDLEMEDEPADDAEAEDFQLGADAGDDEEVEVDEAMLAEEILRIRKLVREGKMDHHFGGKGGDAGVDGSYGGKGHANAGVKKSFGGGAEGQDAFAIPPAIN